MRPVAARENCTVLQGLSTIATKVTESRFGPARVRVPWGRGHVEPRLHVDCIVCRSSRRKRFCRKGKVSFLALNFVMPKVRRSRKPPPEGWELIEPTLDELDQKMREGKLFE